MSLCNYIELIENIGPQSAPQSPPLSGPCRPPFRPPKQSLYRPPLGANLGQGQALPHFGNCMHSIAMLEKCITNYSNL